MTHDLVPTAVMDALRRANGQVAAHWPGEPASRQPVHAFYGGAHLFKANTATRLGELGLAALTTHAPNPEALARALALPGDLALWTKVYERVRKKLEDEPVEDYHLDFEDGYGARPDAEEDGHAQSAAREVARGLTERSLPPFIGIRLKTFSDELVLRSLRTLDIFVTTLVSENLRRLPDNFVVTLPKVTSPEQVATLVAAFEGLEKKLGLGAGTLKLEIMVEVTQSIFDSQGQVVLPAFVAAARGRCVGAHFGTYDYTASSFITAAHQQMSHPACDFAKQVMKVSLAGTGVMISDGATNVMPVGPHHGGALTPAQEKENREVVHRAWKLAYDDIRRSLVTGFYQGWDLHPAQLPVRYAAVYAFFLEAVAPAAARLSAFLDKAAQATLLGDVFDDAATGQGLLNYFLRAMSCGAVTTAEVQAMTGLTPEELRTRSFVKILAGRKR
jgi:citrate lyase beta subunit